MACYYIVISSTHLSNGHFRNIKGVFRGPLSKNGNKNLDYAEKERTATMAKALEDLKANFYCDLCDKQYYKHQEFDNHINSYDHAHKQRLKELKQREFARNVASKTRKDERKQERALRRIHELAEQRREVHCAPGSGPKFKSTTVAVEGSFRDSGTDGSSEETNNSTVLETGTHNHTSTGHATNNKTQKTLYWPYTGKAKKQTYNRHKIAFSFSFPKKASVKLKSSAAVFCDNTEEGSKECLRRQKLRTPLVELNILDSPTAEEKGLGHGTVEAITQPGDLSPNSVSFSEWSQRSSDALARSDIPMPPQASDLCSVLVNSEDMAKPYVSSVSQLPASPDDPDTVLDRQNSEETQRNSPTEAEPETSKHQQAHKVEESVCGEEDSSISSFSSEVVSGSDGPPENGSSSSQSSQCPGTVREEQKGEDITVVVKTLSCPFTKPSQPFFSVLSRDGNTVLQWPTEMLTFTKTEPCLSYSCNPLHFDFRASQQWQSRAKVSVGDSHSKLSVALCISSTSVCAEEPTDVDNKHNNKACSGPNHHSPIRDGREAVERKDCLICEHHTSDTDTESCSLRLKRHSSGGYSRHSKGRTQSEKRAAGGEKWKSRDRRHYRSHKKKGRRRRRGMRGGDEEEEEHHRERETDGELESNAEKCNTFQRRSECWEGLDSQFRVPTSQQVQPLEKSKQSAEDSGCAAPFAAEDRERKRVVERERERVVERKREEEERRRQETAGRVNGSAGSLSLSDEKVLGRSVRRDPFHPSTEQRNTAGHGSKSSQSHNDTPCPEKPPGVVRQNPSRVMTVTAPESLVTVTQKLSMALSPKRLAEDLCESRALKRKRTASMSLADKEQGLDLQGPWTQCQPAVMVEPNGPVLCTQCQSTVEESNGPDGSMGEEGSGWSGCVSCGGEGRQRKRQRGSSYTPHISDPPVGHNVLISDLPVGHNVLISDLPVGHNVLISDPPVGHNVLISDLPVGHKVLISDLPVGHNVHMAEPPVGHNVHISDLPVGHNVHISDLPVGHNVHISDLPVGHNVHMAEPPVGHNVHISDLPVGHNVHISDLPVGHNVHISDLPVGHNVHMAEPPLDVLSVDRCKLNVQSENLVNTAVEYLVVKGPLASCSSLSQPAVEHNSKPMGSSPRFQFQNNVPSMKEECSFSPSQPGPVRDPSNPAEIIGITNENKNSANCLPNSSTVSLPIMVHHIGMGNIGQDCITRQTVAVAAQVSPLGVREIIPPSIPQMFHRQKTSLDKSCQHSSRSHPTQQECHSPQPTQIQRFHPGVRVQDERGFMESLRPGGTNVTASPYHNHRPACFRPQHHVSVCGLFQIQTHRHVLHHHQQHQAFSGKMKQVLSGSPVAVSPSCPPMLHPVHLSPSPMSPMPTRSITIRHTILHHQHHHRAAFLPPHPQPTLLPHVLPVPVSSLPMGAEMCPSGPYPSPFVTSPPQLSVMAPPNLHHHPPMSVTFHAMPRPAMFPSMLQPHPHPTVIPLQPMF
ncbi:zinc finger protein 804A isoform X1 [Salmo salar]|uniref:Zinc finger protein 804A isoform X1 n=1 Tax=Salmo salar TaxID=8030 RepID=A0ABM3DPV9_SALSA|nr:zinc finger protein 804A isoform X1 [Salmo salar]